MLLVFSEGQNAFYGLQKFPVYFNRPQDIGLETFKQLFFIFLDCNSILVFFFLLKAGLPIPTLKGFHSFTSAVV